MDVLLHVTTPDAARIVVPLGRALSRAGASWAVFLTNDGVRVLDDGDAAGVLSDAGRVAVCEHSWDLHCAGRACPVERGSQTVNSALMAEAARVVSL